MDEQQGILKREARVPPELIEKLLRGEMTLGEFVGLKRGVLYQIARVGYQMLLSGKHAEAKQIYLGLVAAAPYDSVFHCHLAAVYHRLGELDRALDEYTKALRFNRANADALAGRGELHLTQGQVAESITDLQAAVKLDPHGKRGPTLRARAILLTLKEAADEQRQKHAEEGSRQ